jgi:predicted RNase H-like nuclease (RuvC/YqgF family)
MTMATAKKTPAKTAKPVAKAAKPVVKAKAPAPAPKAPMASRQQEEQFRMPLAVSEWIEQANSRMKNLQSKIDRLETENKELKAYKKWAEHRILGSSHE